MKNRQYNDEMFRCIRNYLDEKDMNYLCDSEKGLIFYRHDLECSLRLADLLIVVQEHGYDVEVTCPAAVDPGDEARMSTTVDYCRLVSGKLICLWDAPRDTPVLMIPHRGSGTVSIRAGFRSTPEMPLPDRETLERHMRTPLVLMQGFGDGILEIALGDGRKSAKEILRLCDEINARRVERQLRRALEEIRRELNRNPEDDADEEDEEEGEELEAVELFDPEDEEEGSYPQSHPWFPPEDDNTKPADG